MKIHYYIAILGLLAISCKQGEQPVIPPEEQEDILEKTAKTLVDELDVDKWGGEVDFVLDFTDHIDWLSRTYPGSTDVFDSWYKEGEDAVYALPDMGGGDFEEIDHKFEFTSTASNEVSIIAYPEGKRAAFKMIYGSNSDVYKVNVDGDEVKVRVPGRLAMFLNDETSARVMSTLNISVKDSDRDGILDENKDLISLNGNLKMAGYILTINDFVIDRPNLSSSSFVISHNDKMVISFNGEFQGDNQAQPGWAKVDADFLGQVQIRGRLDADLVKRSREEYPSIRADLPKLQAMADNLNENMALNVFYEGGNTLQARLGVDVFRDMDGSGNWHISPVFLFEDGSSRTWDEFSDSALSESLKDWAERINKYFKPSESEGE